MQCKYLTHARELSATITLHCHCFTLSRRWRNRKNKASQALVIETATLLIQVWRRSFNITSLHSPLDSVFDRLTLSRSTCSRLPLVPWWWLSMNCSIDLNRSNLPWTTATKRYLTCRQCNQWKTSSDKANINSIKCTTWKEHRVNSWAHPPKTIQLRMTIIVNCVCVSVFAWVYFSCLFLTMSTSYVLHLTYNPFSVCPCIALER